MKSNESVLIYQLQTDSFALKESLHGISHMIKKKNGEL